MDENPYAAPSVARARACRPGRDLGFWLRTLFSSGLWFLVTGTLGWAITGHPLFGLVSGILGSLLSVGAWLWIDRGE